MWRDTTRASEPRGTRRVILLHLSRCLRTLRARPAAEQLNFSATREGLWSEHCVPMLWSPFSCRFTTYRHRFARAAPAPRAKIQRIVDCGRAPPVNLFLSRARSARRRRRRKRGPRLWQSRQNRRDVKYASLLSDHTI